MKLYGLRLQNPTRYLVIPISSEDYSIGLNELQHYNIFNHIDIDYSRSIPRIRFYKYPKRLFPERFRFYPGFVTYDDIRGSSFWSLSDLINTITVTPGVVSSLILKNKDCEFLCEFPDIDNFHEYFFKLLNRYQPAFNSHAYNAFKEDLMISWVKKFKPNKISEYESNCTVYKREEVFGLLNKLTFKDLPLFCLLD